MGILGWTIIVVFVLAALAGLFMLFRRYRRRGSVLASSGARK